LITGFVDDALFDQFSRAPRRIERGVDCGTVADSVNSTSCGALWHSGAVFCA
jgi:hypothetical protein